MTWRDLVLVQAFRRRLEESQAHKAEQDARDYDAEAACRSRHPSSLP